MIILTSLIIPMTITRARETAMIRLRQEAHHRRMTAGAAAPVRHPRVTTPAAARLQEAAIAVAAAVGHLHLLAVMDHRTRHHHHPPAMIPAAALTIPALRDTGPRVRRYTALVQSILDKKPPDPDSRVPYG